MGLSQYTSQYPTRSKGNNVQLHNYNVRQISILIHEFLKNLPTLTPFRACPPPPPLPVEKSWLRYWGTGGTD